MDQTNTSTNESFPKHRSEVLALEYVKLHSTPDQTPEEFAKAYADAVKRIKAVFAARG